MGIGDPEGLLEVIARGVDIFDCVLPTRTARMGTAFTPEGRLNLRNARARPLHGAAGARLPLSRPAPGSPEGPSGTSSCRRRSSGSSCSPSTT